MQYIRDSINQLSYNLKHLELHLPYNDLGKNPDNIQNLVGKQLPKNLEKLVLSLYGNNLAIY